MTILTVENLQLAIKNPSQNTVLLNQLSFSLQKGEIVGLIGESGCGKSLTASAIVGTLPLHYSLSGVINFEGINLTKQSVSKVCGSRIGLIMQDPTSALNPLVSLGIQLIEGVIYHKKLSKQEAYVQGIEWLKRVGIDDPSYRFTQYPHEISGGMKQRFMIAMALICQPSLVIADEPTTALDMTVQKQILDLLLQIHQEEQMSLLLITHDIGVVMNTCQRVLVMKKGQIVESGLVEKVFTNPQHPYTQNLISARKFLEP